MYFTFASMGFSSKLGFCANSAHEPLPVGETEAMRRAYAYALRVLALRPPKSERRLREFQFAHSPALTEFVSS